MFLLLAQLLFRINSPETSINFANKKKNIKFQECLQNQKDNSLNIHDVMKKCKHLKEDSTEDDDDGIYFEDTSFTSQIANNQKYGINADNVELYLVRCNFTNILFSEGLIYSNSPTFNSTLRSNIIKGCYNKNQAISSATNIFYSNALYNDIQDNTVTFTDKEHSCRAFQIQKSTNTIFNNNRITNANVGNLHDDIASCLLFNEGGTGIPLQFSGNIFSNCNGGNGALLVLNQVDYNVHIYDTTFEWSKNNELKNSLDEPSGYYIHVNVKDNTNDPQLTFQGCTFDHLESNSKGGGSIGLWFREKQKMTMTLTFDNCHFTNLYFSDENQPGGAILFYCEASNKNTDLTVSNCEFKNISSEMDGAAIYFQSMFSIVVQNTSFIDAISIGQGETKSAIYIEFYDRDQTVTIEDCKFESTSADVLNNAYNVITLLSSNYDNNKCTINHCVFKNCAKSGSIIISEDIDEFEFINSEIDSTCGGISLSPVYKFKIQNSVFKNIDSAIYALSKGFIDYECILSDCVFDSCTSSDADSCSSFELELEVTALKFANNEIKGTDFSKNIYLGKINCWNNIDTLIMQNITFSNNKCSSMYGGGTGLLIQGISKIEYKDCKFTNNFARQNKEVKNVRPKASSDEKYYNGDGGAIQIGYSSLTSEMDVLFDTCIFQNNQAFRHGGAIAIQTLQVVEIINCIFESNVANIKSNTPKLLYDNHFSKKNEGRGGAIYINPCFTYQDGKNTYPAEGILMTSIKIEGCTFDSNKAFDGYAIYIEGDESASTKFIITNNDFNNNINKDTHKNTCAVIASEISNIYDGKVPNENIFKYDDGSSVKEIIYVDHYGKAPSYHAIYGSNFKKESGTWTDTNNYHIKSTVANSIASLTFDGIGFTLHGAKNTGYGSFIVKIDEYEYMTINENGDAQTEVELCISPELEFKTHKVTIIAEANVEISKIEINTYYNPKFIDINTFEGAGSWTQIDNKQGGHRLFTNTALNTLVTTATCSQFYIYGQKGPGQGTISVRVDTIEVASDISTSSNTQEDFALLYVSKPTEPSSVSFHTIQIVAQSGNVYIDNLVYTDHDIYLEANHTEFDYEGGWINADSGHSTSNEDDTLEFLYYGTAFKIFGSKGSSFASLKISLDGNEIGTVSTNAEKDLKHVHLYSSADNGVAINCGQHLIKISLAKGNVANGKIEVCRIIYLQPKTPPSPTQSLTPPPSETILFTETPSEVITETPSEEQSSEVITETPSKVITETPSEEQSSEVIIETPSKVITETPSEVITETPSEEQSSEVITETPSKVVTETPSEEQSSEVITETPSKVITGTPSEEQSSEVITETSTKVVTETPSEEQSSEVIVETSSEVIAESSSAESTSEEPLPDDIFVDGNCNKDKRCQKVVDETSNDVVHVYVEVTMFDGFPSHDYGGAIYLIRCGVTCDKSKFKNCRANKGGGAIFIRNDLQQKNNITITGIEFTGCSASFGGAIYAYSSNKIVPVRISFCTFNQNTIVPDLTNTQPDLVGGCSIFLTARNGKVISCTFNDENTDDHGSLKLFNNYELKPNSNANFKMLDSMNENFVSVVDCKFKVNEKAKNSILYVRGLSDVDFEVKNCEFSGILSENSHYIEEKVLVENAPKLRIKSCTFNDDSKKSLLLDSTNDYLKISQQNKFNDGKVSKKKNESLKVVATILLPTLALIAIISLATLFLIKLNSIEDNNNDDNHNNDSNEKIDL